MWNELLTSQQVSSLTWRPKSKQRRVWM